MRRYALPAVLAALTLSLAACGGDGEDGASGEASPGATSTSAEAAELGEGVAAVVNGDEIAQETLDDRVETAAASPELAEVLEGENGEQARAQLRASILSQLIVNEIVVDGAEGRGLEIDDEAVDRTREELTTQAGGEDAFAEQVGAAGLDEDQLSAELEAITALRLVRDDLTGEDAGGASPAATAPSPGATPDAADMALQEWLIEQLQTAEITVAPEIGTWDPVQGTIVPPGAVAPPQPQAPPTGDAPAPGGATEPATGGATEPATPAATEE